MAYFTDHKCFCGVHVHTAIFPICIIGLILNIILSLGDVLTRQPGYSSLCGFSIACYVCLFVGSRTANLGLYWPYFIIKPALLLSFVITAIVIYIEAVIILSSYYAHEAVDKLSERNLEYDNTDGKIFIALATFYLITPIVHSYFMYLAIKDYTHVKRKLVELKPFTAASQPLEQ